MDLQLADKSALITGSTAGIGLAIAKTLAAEGASVVLNGRTEARVSEAVDAVRQMDCKGAVRGISADLSTAGGARKLVEALPQVEILVNNAGFYDPKPFNELTDEDWQRAFDLNVMSGVRLSRAYLDSMLRANWGRIIFISSESAVQIPAEMIQYGTTKTAQIAVARGLAELTAGTNVTVNSVLVGPTRSEGVEQFVSRMAAAQRKDEAAVQTEFFKNIRPTSLLKRFLDPEEVARTVTFLASPLTVGINGAAIRTDGGVLRGIL